MLIDRTNPYQGQLRFFWGSGKPIIHDGVVYIGFSKVGSFGEDYIAHSEACFLRSDNLLTAVDPEQVHWETLPAGDYGLSAPEGLVAEEPSLVSLSDASLYCTYRSNSGFACHAYSRDGGYTWTPPAYMDYGFGEVLVSNPRAANFVWKTQNGRYLYWFHNHRGTGYNNRNPVWLSGGIEYDSDVGKNLCWSRPQVVLYDVDITSRISYPDLIEDGNRYFLTETNKSVARVHEIPASFVESLWDDAEQRLMNWV
jgi:hypothetical protein